MTCIRSVAEGTEFFVIEPDEFPHTVEEERTWIQDHWGDPGKIVLLAESAGAIIGSVTFEACKEVLGSVGIDLTLDQFKEISLRRGESTLVLATEQGVTADDVERLRKERDRMCAELMEARSCVIDGAEDVLRVLYGRVRMGVVTSARRQHFEAAHGKSGLAQYMDFVLTREDYTQSKPHPEPYLTAMKCQGLRPDQCIIVEDSERGLAAATAAGVDCIIVLSEWTKDGDFSDARAVVENIAGVLEVVLRHISEG